MCPSSHTHNQSCSGNCLMTPPMSHPSETEQGRGGCEQVGRVSRQTKLISKRGDCAALHSPQAGGFRADGRSCEQLQQLNKILGGGILGGSLVCESGRATVAAATLGAKILETRFSACAFPLWAGPSGGLPRWGQQNGDSGSPRQLGFQGSRNEQKGNAETGDGHSARDPTPRCGPVPEPHRPGAERRRTHAGATRKTLIDQGEVQPHMSAGRGALMKQPPGLH